MPNTVTSTPVPSLRTVFEEWQVDAITLSPYGQDLVAPFFGLPSGDVCPVLYFNPALLLAVQHYPWQFPYLRVVKESKTWGTPEQLGLEVGTTGSLLRAVLRKKFSA